MMTNELYEKYSKLGGWLLFFTVACFINIIFSISELASYGGELEPLLEWQIFSANMMVFLSYLEPIAIIGTFGFLIYAILNHYPSKTLKKTIIGLLFIRIVSLILLYIFAYLFINEIAPGQFGVFLGSAESIQAIVNVIAALIFTTVWFNYFDKSVRVAVYVGEIDPPTQDKFFSAMKD